MTYQLGTDVGGTFTDFVAIDGAGRVSVFKQLTTPDDPSRAVLEGAGLVAERAGVSIAEATRIVHGTTLVTNSLIERRGSKVVLVATRGFRDVLEIAKEARHDLYDLNLERPEPLVPRPLRIEVDERISATGEVLEPLSDEEVGRIVDRLRELGAESVAVALLNSYVNSAHEQQLADAIRISLPDVDVTLSSKIAPAWREYERTSTAAANAFVRPAVRRYLRRLEEGLAALGAPDSLYVLMSQGGVTSADVAAEYAIQMVESGPAGGVMAAAFFGRRLGIEDLIAFDMGGTTTKASLVIDGEPEQVSEFEVARVARFKKGSGLPLMVPTLELIEIGAGGGSIGRADSLGLLKVGPQSAGAVPGPACYGRGGTAPTVTDADLHLGLLDPGYFLGGAMALDPEAAEAALAHLGERLGIDAEACARGMFEILNDQTSLALRTHVVERAHDPRRFALVASGGAGPVHAYEVARRLGIRVVVCPPAAGVASALGFLVSPFAVDLARTLPVRLGSVDWAGVEAVLAELAAEARELLARAGARVDDVVLERRVDMRYAGQGYEVPVALPDGPLGPHLEERLRADFDEGYRTRFGFQLTTAAVEGLHWHVAATVGGAEPLLEFAAGAGGDPVKGERHAYFPELSGRATATVYDRYALGAGVRVEGPALIEERESTIVVGPSGAAEVDELGNLRIQLG
jgi:N-methylhydantoinase A